MGGRSAVAEVMNGAGPVSEVAGELAELEAAMADPERADEMEDIIERYGEVQARFEELGGYALEGKAREVLGGPELLARNDGRRCRRAVGRLENARRAWRAFCSCAPT